MRAAWIALGLHSHYHFFLHRSLNAEHRKIALTDHFHPLRDLDLTDMNILADLESGHIHFDPIWKILGQTFNFETS